MISAPVMAWPARGCADGAVGGGVAAMLFTGGLVAGWHGKIMLRCKGD